MHHEMTVMLVMGLARATLAMTAAAVVVWLTLRLLRCRSPRVERCAWCLVLLQGWLFVGPTVRLPWYAAARVQPRARLVQSDPAPRAPVRTESARHPPAALVRVESSTAPVTTAAAPMREDSEPTSSPTKLVKVTRANTAAVHSQARSITPAATMTGRWGNNVTRNRGLLALFIGAWAIGMAAIVFRHVWRYLRYLRQITRDTLLNDLLTATPARLAAIEVPSAWQDEWRAMVAQPSGLSHVTLRLTSHHGPLVCRRVRADEIVIPRLLWQTLDAEARVAILRHELAHVVRGDLWKSLAVRVLALPQWFNPLAWWATRRFDECAELLCDQQACQQDPQQAITLARALVELVERSSTLTSAHAPFSPAASGRTLSVRIRRLLSPAPQEDSAMKRIFVFSTALALVAIGLVRLQLVAQEAEKREPDKAKPVAAASDERPAKTVKPKIPKDKLRFDGKSFEQWQEELETELKPERRVEAVEAFAAFAERGYSREAGEILIKLSRELDFYTISGDPEGKLKSAILKAFTKVDDDVALPLLVEELKASVDQANWAMMMALTRFDKVDASAIDAIKEHFDRHDAPEARAYMLQLLGKWGADAELYGKLLQQLLNEDPDGVGTTRLKTFAIPTPRSEDILVNGRRRPIGSLVPNRTPGAWIQFRVIEGRYVIHNLTPNSRAELIETTPELTDLGEVALKVVLQIAREQRGEARTNTLMLLTDMAEAAKSHQFEIHPLLTQTWLEGNAQDQEFASIILSQLEWNEAAVQAQLPTWITMLKSSDRSQRMRAIERLQVGRVRPASAEAVPQLIENFHGADREERQAIFRAIQPNLNGHDTKLIFQIYRESFKQRNVENTSIAWITHMGLGSAYALANGEIKNFDPDGTPAADEVEFLEQVKACVLEYLKDLPLAMS